MARIKTAIPLAFIDSFKFNQIKARKFAGLIQNGIDFPPIHLQKLTDTRYRIRDGKHRAAAALLLGKTGVYSKFSITKENKK